MTVPRLPFIGEAEARQIPVGATVELEPGGHVTPLARDTLRERRVTVVTAGSSDPALPADLAPPYPVRRVVVGATVSGRSLQALLVEHLRQEALAVIAYGGPDAAALSSVEAGAVVARAVARGQTDAGIAIDETGMMAAVAANKVRGVRATVCLTPRLARRAREEAGANVLTLGAIGLEPADALAIVDAWLSTPARDARHLRQVLAIRGLEEQG